MARFGPETIDRLRGLLPDDDGSAIESEFRPAAVLIPLFVREDTVHVLLTRRTENVRTHRGQVSFPGGAWEARDPSLQETALREAHEEVGLHRDDVRILGVLPDLPTAVSGFQVRPFVAEIPHPYDFVQDAAEVAHVFAPALEIFADASRRREEFRERGGERYPIFYFDVHDNTVWGATARMLVTLTDLLG